MAKVRPISEELIIKRMRLENPWWDGKPVPEADKKRRLYFDLLYKQITQKKVRRAVILMGPRRVGKTVILYQSIAQLLADKTPQRKICYLSIDAPIYNNIGLEELFAMCRKAVGDDDPEGYTIIFDEIQYLKEWERHLKSIVDFFPKTRFIASGSAAAALKMKSNESGAGRFTDFMLPPLTFQEYLYLKDLTYLTGSKNGEFDDDTFMRNIEVINRHFIDYINFGGYPEVIFSEEIQQDPGRFIRSDIIDKVLLRDLPSLYGIRDVQELNSLFNVIAYNNGNEFNLDGLSQQSGVAKLTIRKYLEYLEAAFLIKILYPVGINTKRFQRDTRFKIYLTNPSMRCALFAPINEGDEQFGQMVECAIITQFLHADDETLYFACWQGGEVDLIITDVQQKLAHVMEVKWSDQYVHRPHKLKSLMKYCEKNNFRKAIITTKKTSEITMHDNIRMYFSPAAMSCFEIGVFSLGTKDKAIARKVFPYLYD